MRTEHDLGGLSWTLAGYIPESWRPPWDGGMQRQRPELEVPARVPGSVQGSLLAAGAIPDWHQGLDHRQCEWVEHRHWAFACDLPDAWVRPGARQRLRCAGLDHQGWILLNGRIVGEFASAHQELIVDLAPHLRPAGNRLEIIFDMPPRWQGQYGRTSAMTDLKPRFYYTWDWTPRVVQIGITGSVVLETVDGPAIGTARCRATADGLRVQADAGGRPLRLRLADAAGTVLREGVFSGDCAWDGLPVDAWWPNGEGPQPLYTVVCELAEGGTVHDRRSWSVGFKSVEWRMNPGAPAGADPWLCAVNGRPLFLQGVNWVPIRCAFADVEAGDYRRRLTAYRDLGCNLVRVWGGGGLEREEFYALCDELGLLVWQEFPLSSSGFENWPPGDAGSVAALGAIAAEWIRLRQHHACLLMWCGGNELQGDLAGNPVGVGRPIDGSQPAIAAMARAVAELDPGRRFVPSSASGPRFMADAADFGKGLHWDVHGPWKGESQAYWDGDDALFRSEVGAPGAGPAALIRRHAGGQPTLPASWANPLYRLCSWWIEDADFRAAHDGRDPRDLDEYVAWSQARQADALARAARACKGRFPRCGGFIVWMGHDAFPCAVNTAILDFGGEPKPAALALAAVFRART